MNCGNAQQRAVGIRLLYPQINPESVMLFLLDTSDVSTERKWISSDADGTTFHVIGHVSINLPLCTSDEEVGWEGGEGEGEVRLINVYYGALNTTAEYATTGLIYLTSPRFRLCLRVLRVSFGGEALLDRSANAAYINVVCLDNGGSSLQRETILTEYLEHVYIASTKS